MKPRSSVVWPRATPRSIFGSPDGDHLGEIVPEAARSPNTGAQIHGSEVDSLTARPGGGDSSSREMKRCRDHAGLSQRKMAARLGISAAYVVYLKTAQRTPVRLSSLSRP